MTTYIDPFTGLTINPSQVGYESLSISTDTALQWPINGNTSNVVAGIIEVTATTTGLKLFMPPATQVSEGQSVIINNVGSNPFTLVDNSGNTIFYSNTGVIEYIYLTDNTTTNGTWKAFTFGAGSSSATASQLVASSGGTYVGGLTVNGQYLQQNYNVKIIYSNYTPVYNDLASLVLWQGGVGSLTLSASTNFKAGWYVIVRNGGTGILTITPSGSETIDGNTNAQLQLTESFVLVNNGSGWNTFAYGRSNAFFYTQLQLNVTGGTTTLTTAQASNTIQEFSGTLTSNQIIILPSTVQLYSLQNNTTGAFSMTFKTSVSGGLTLNLPSGQTILAICDGKNVYNAQTAPVSSATTFTVGNGSAGAPSFNFAGDTTTGLYLPSTGQLGFAISGGNSMTLTGSGLSVVGTVTASAGIGGGTF